MTCSTHGSVIRTVPHIKEYTDLPTAEDVIEDSFNAVVIQNEDIMKDCANFTNKDFKFICRKIASNPIVASIGNIGNIANITKEVQLSERVPDSKNKPHVLECKKKAKVCPDYSEGTPVNAPSNKRSLSPWEYCENKDVNRYSNSNILAI